MVGSRRLGVGMLALLLLAGEVAPLRANTPPPLPYPKPDPIPKPDPLFAPAPNPEPNPAPSPVQNPPPNKEMWPNDPVVRPAPKRTGPFRSCGSGAGTGLAGIAVAWAMLWLGNRFARSLSRSPSARG